MDEDGNIVDSDKATRFIAREEDMQGNLLNETFGIVNKDNALEDIDDDMIYVSKEDYDYYMECYQNGDNEIDINRLKVRK